MAKKKDTTPAPAPASRLLPRLFAAAFGAFLGMALLKFGNPPIMEKWVAAPSNFFEFLVGSPWPLNWAYVALFGVALIGLGIYRLNPRPPMWLTWLPLAWLIWTIASGTGSIDKALSHVTLVYFTACVACFYLGLFGLSRVEDPWPFYAGVFCGLILVLAIGFGQHFGTLEESRKYFFRELELYPERRHDVPPEFLKKIASTRIYSTLFYANSLAGAVLIFLPVMLVAASALSDRLQSVAKSRLPMLAAILGTALACMVLYMMNSKVGWVLAAAVGLAMVLPIPQWILPGLVGLASAACLYWSGSKGGWLLLLLLGLIALLRLPFRKQLKIALVTLVLVGGLAGFFVKYAAFFRKGATSVVARFDYWHAATVIIGEHPLLGTGPGTFAIPYQRIKRPESEMARLVHNDYLEQASDSGIPASLAYTVFIFGALSWTYRYTVRTTRGADGRLMFALWLGVLGWSLQCFFEFSLYIPPLAWAGFAFLGFLLGKARPASAPNSPPNTTPV